MASYVCITSSKIYNIWTDVCAYRTFTTISVCSGISLGLLSTTSECMSVKMVAGDAEWIRLHFILCDEMWTQFCENCCMQLSLWGMSCVRSYVCAQCTYSLIPKRHSQHIHTHTHGLGHEHGKRRIRLCARCPHIRSVFVTIVCSVPWFISSLHFGAHWIIRNIHSEIDIFQFPFALHRHAMHRARRCDLFGFAHVLHVCCSLMFGSCFSDFQPVHRCILISLYVLHSNAFTYTTSMCRALIGD